MNVKISVFVICVEAIVYLLLYNLNDSNFKLIRSLLSSSILAAMSRTIEKSDVPSANNFALMLKPSGRSLI